jgi:dihydrofolate reductase
MLVSLLFAMDEDNAIGLSNKLPWHLPADLKWFKQHTMGHHIIMGRNTYESIGKLLPGRKTVIISRNLHYKIPGASTYPSLDIALKEAKQAGETEAFIIGGAELFKSAIDIVDRFYLTRIHYKFEADTYLPALNMDEWKILSEERHEADEKNKWAYTFYVLDRKNARHPA